MDARLVRLGRSYRVLLEDGAPVVGVCVGVRLWAHRSPDVVVKLTEGFETSGGSVLRPGEVIHVPAPFVECEVEGKPGTEEGKP